MSKLLLVSSDLVLSSRIQGATANCGLALTTAADHAAAVAACDDDCRVVLLDLRTAGLDVAALVEGLRQHSAKLSIVACGPHVHAQRLKEARAAGCDMVVTRGQLDQEAESILRRILDMGT